MTFYQKNQSLLQVYIDRLIQLGSNKSAPEVAELNNQLTLEVMLKTVFGDGSIDLLGSEEDSEIALAFRHICKFAFSSKIICFEVAGFKYKLENILCGLVARLPLIGPLIAKAFIKPIRDMYSGFAIRDRYISALIAAKRIELEENLEVFMGSTFNIFKRTHNNSKSFCRPLITVTSGHRDLITLLLKCTDAQGTPTFTGRQIHAQLFTFLFAGFETTSTAIHSILYNLGDEPEWADKIAAEFEVSVQHF